MKASIRELNPFLDAPLEVVPPQQLGVVTAGTVVDDDPFVGVDDHSLVIPSNPPEPGPFDDGAAGRALSRSERATFGMCFVPARVEPPSPCRGTAVRCSLERPPPHRT